MTKERKESILRKLKNKITSKGIIKQDKATLTIKEYKPEPYKSIYFKNAYEKEKKLFFS